MNIIDVSKLSKWDERFWNLAKFVAEWSKDPKAQVGSVIATNKGGAIALGFNGFPARVEDTADRLNISEEKLPRIIHAEQNALLIAGRIQPETKIIVVGKPICSSCAGLIIQSGIEEVISEDPENLDEDSNWREPGKIAIEMFEEAKLRVTLIKE